MKYLLRRCEIFLAENEIPYGMKYLPLANIKGLRRVYILLRSIASVGLNSIVSGFPTLIEVRRSRKRHCLSAEISMAFAAYKIHFIKWNLFQFLNHNLCTLVNITAAESDYNVTLFCVCKHIVCNFLKAVEPDASGNFLCKILCVNSVGVDLA